MTHQEQPDSQAGDEQTETDELSPRDIIALYWQNIEFGAGKGITDAEAIASIQAWSRQQTARVLQRLHRTDGEGLPKRDYDNVTDEAIDAELAALRVGLESDND